MNNVPVLPGPTRKSIRIPYFPKELRYLTPLGFALAGYVIWAGLPILGGIVLLVSLTILNVHYVTELDLEKRNYHDYLSFFGIPLNSDRSSFRDLNRIIISKGRYHQNVNSRIRSGTISWVDYTATLLVDNGTPLNLLTRNDKGELLLALRDLAKFLGTPVEDHTLPHPATIDLNRIS